MVLSTVMVGGSFTVDAADTYYLWYGSGDAISGLNNYVAMTFDSSTGNYTGSFNVTAGGTYAVTVNTTTEHADSSTVKLAESQTADCNLSYFEWVNKPSTSGNNNRCICKFGAKGAVSVKVTFNATDKTKNHGFNIYVDTDAISIVNNPTLTITNKKDGSDNTSDNKAEIYEKITLEADYDSLGTDANESDITDYTFYIDSTELETNTIGTYEYTIPKNATGTLNFKVKINTEKAGYQSVESEKTAYVEVPASYSIAGRFAINDFGTEKKIGWVPPGTSSEIKFDYVGKVGTSYEYRLDTGKTINELSQKINQQGYDQQYFYITNDDDDNNKSYGKSTKNITNAEGVANKIDLAKTTSEALSFNNSTSTDERKVVLHLLVGSNVNPPDVKLYYTLEDESTYSQIYACDGNLRTSGETKYSKNFGHTTVTAEEPGVLKTDSTHAEYSTYTAKVGKEVTISTTVDSAYKALYVNAFVVNGVKLPATHKASSRTYTATYTVTSEDVEIYPVYYNKYAEDAKDYITVYVDASEIQNSDNHWDNHWGDMIAAYTYYENGRYEMDAGYPGQPMMYDPSVGYYVGKVARHAWDPTYGTEIKEAPVQGVVFSNFAEGNNDVHKSFVTVHDKDKYFRDGEAVNFQTYDYDDFVDLASHKEIKYTIKYSGLTYKDYYHDDGRLLTIHSGYGSGDDYKRLIYSNQKKFNLQSQDGGTGYRTNDETAANIGTLHNSFKNGWRTLEEFDGYNATISGKKVADDLLDKTTEEGKRPVHFLQVVSVGNQHHSIGRYATVWYVYDENGNYITCGIPSDFLDENSPAYTAIKNRTNDSFTEYEKAVTYITYESEMCSQTSYQVDDNGNYDQYALNSENKLRNTGVRVDGRWTYSRDTRNVNVQIMYGQDAAAVSDSSWTPDTYGGDKESDIQGVTTSANATVSFKDSEQDKSNVRFGRTIEIGTNINLIADTSSEDYNFVGWYVATTSASSNARSRSTPSPQAYEKLTDEATYTAPLNENTTYYAMYVPKASVHVKSAYYTGGSNEDPLDITSSNNKTVMANWNIEGVEGDDRTIGATTGAVAKAEFTYIDSDNHTITGRDITEHINLRDDVTITADKSSTKASKKYKLVGWYVEGTDTDEGKFVPVNYKTSIDFDADGKLGGTVTLNTPSVTVYALYIEQFDVETKVVYTDGSNTNALDTANDGTGVTKANTKANGLNTKITVDKNTLVTFTHSEEGSTYSFSGWKADRDTGAPNVLPLTENQLKITEKTTLYAAYTAGNVNLNAIPAFKNKPNDEHYTTTNASSITKSTQTITVGDNSSKSGTLLVTQNTEVSDDAFTQLLEDDSEYVFLGWTTKDPTNATIASSDILTSTPPFKASVNTTYYALYVKKLPITVTHNLYKNAPNAINPNNGSGDFSISAKVDEGTATTSSIVHDGVASVTITPDDSIVKDLYLGTTEHYLNVTLTATPDTNNTNRSSYVQPYGDGPYIYPGTPTTPQLNLTTLYNNSYTTTNYYTDIEKNKAKVEVKIKRQHPTNRTTYEDDSASTGTTGTVTNATAKVNEARSQEVYIGTALDTLSFVANPTGTDEVEGINHKYYKFKGWYDKDGNAITGFSTKTVSATAEDNVIYAYYDIVTVTVNVETRYTDSTHDKVMSINNSPITNAYADLTPADSTGVSTVTVDKGSEVTLTKVDTSGDYKFNKWTGGEVSSDNKFIAYDDTTLVANYILNDTIAINVKVEYKKYNNSKQNYDNYWTPDDKGTVATATDASVISGNAANITTAFASGKNTYYEFLGWYNSEDPTYKVCADPSYTISNVTNEATYIARYRQKTVDIEAFIKYKDSPTATSWKGETAYTDTEGNVTKAQAGVGDVNTKKLTVGAGSNVDAFSSENDDYVLYGWSVNAETTISNAEPKPSFTDLTEDKDVYAYFVKVGSIKLIHGVYSSTTHSKNGTTYIDGLKIYNNASCTGDPEFSNNNLGASGAITATTYSGFKKLVVDIYKGDHGHYLKVDLKLIPNTSATNVNNYTYDTYYKQDNGTFNNIHTSKSPTAINFDSNVIALTPEFYAAHMNADTNSDQIISFYSDFLKEVTVTVETQVKQSDGTYAINTSINQASVSTPNTVEYITIGTKNNVTINAPANTGYVFDGWFLEDGSSDENIAVATGDQTYTPDENIKLIARYSKAAPTTNNVKVQFKYYDRKVAHNIIPEINKKVTTVNYAKDYTLTTGIDTVVNTAYNDAEIGEIKNVIDEYKFWINQNDAVEGIKTQPYYHGMNTMEIDLTQDHIPTFEEKVDDSTKFAYHTNCYASYEAVSGYTQNEQWVTYYREDSSGNYVSDSKRYSKVTETGLTAKDVDLVVVWGFNTLRTYTVNVYYPTDESAVSIVNSSPNAALATNIGDGVEMKTYKSFYNMRLAGSDNATDESTPHLEGYGIKFGYFKEDFLGGEMVDHIGNNNFAYWRDSKGQVASTDLEYGYRITKNESIAAVYSNETTKQGINVTALGANPNDPDDTYAYVDETTGKKKIRINNVMNIYGYDDYYIYDPENKDKVHGIKNIAAIYLRFTDGTDPATFTEDNWNTIKDDIKYYLSHSSEAVLGTSTALTVSVKGSKKSLVCKYQTTNEGDTDTFVELTTKNRFQFTLSATATSFTNTSGAYYNLVVFTAANFGAGDDGEYDNWVLSENCIHYKKGAVCAVY